MGANTEVLVKLLHIIYKLKVIPYYSVRGSAEDAILGVLIQKR